MTNRHRAGQPPSEGTASARRLLGQHHQVDGAYLEGSHARMVAGQIEERPAVPPAWHLPPYDEDQGIAPINAWAEVRLWLFAAVVVGAITAALLWAAKQFGGGA
jgi:hypothetical protein